MMTFACLMGRPACFMCRTTGYEATRRRSQIKRNRHLVPKG